MNKTDMIDFLKVKMQFPQLDTNNQDLDRAKSAFDVWTHYIVPVHGFNESSVNVICCLLESLYCLGYAAGKRATMLSNWQVAGEDKE